MKKKSAPKQKLCNVCDKFVRKDVIIELVGFSAFRSYARRDALLTFMQQWSSNIRASYFFFCSYYKFVGQNVFLLLIFHILYYYVITLWHGIRDTMKQLYNTLYGTVNNVHSVQCYYFRYCYTIPCSCLLAISHSGPVDKDLFLRYNSEYTQFCIPHTLSLALFPNHKSRLKCLFVCVCARALAENILARDILCSECRELEAKKRHRDRQRQSAHICDGAHCAQELHRIDKQIGAK